MVKMVVVGGVRYRPEDAPKRAPAATQEKAAQEPANKARKPHNKKKVAADDDPATADS